MTDNPFEVTKAVDFTDEQIAATWVDLPGGGFTSLASPRSPMPTFLVGGKGGGRTHFLRYFSFPVQKIRHSGDVRAGIEKDGYVGIYFRCGGLNSSRFAGKGQDIDKWTAAFSYYTELWLGRLTLDLLSDYLLLAPDAVSDAEIEALVTSVRERFDSPIEESPDRADLESLRAVLRDRQRELDVAINNAALTRTLDINIAVSPGKLVFGVPQAVREHLSAFAAVDFAYLIDEFENLTLDQQRYVNTLVREKELPATFLIGSRLVGLRTHETLAAGEENRRGSEFDLVVLEEEYRAQSHKYSTFCAQIVSRRLSETPAGWSERRHPRELFDPAGESRKATPEERAYSQVRTARRLDRRPWIERIESQLATADLGCDVDRVIAAVSFVESPLHEKFALLLLYRAWADGEDLDVAAQRISDEILELMSGEDPKSRLSTSYKHYKTDLYAQIRNELRLPQEYVSFDAFVRMSGYLPRNLLVVLKQIARWSIFQGERPFEGGTISAKAQIEGVREASAWFLSDAKGLGRIGEETEFAIRRLGSFFRGARFADKPVEVSCSSFSTDKQGLSAAAIACLNDAVEHSLLLEVPVGRKDKNTHVLNYKYQLNPMLAPHFDLSLALRGSMSFSSADMNAIFDAADEQGYEELKRRVIGRMRAPFALVEPAKNGQETLDLG